MKISYNALAGNIETVNEFEGEGGIEKVVRPEREALRQPTGEYDWTFRYDMSADIKAEERAAEATVQALMLGTLSEERRLNSGLADLNLDDNVY